MWKDFLLLTGASFSDPIRSLCLDQSDLLFRTLGDKVVNLPLATLSLAWLLHGRKSLLCLLSAVKVKLVMSTCGTYKSKASGAKQTTNLNKHNRVKNSSWLETNQLFIILQGWMRT